MTETFTDERWNTFESSGRVSDYLAYKGIGSKSISSPKGEMSHADNNGGNGSSCNGCGG